MKTKIDVPIYECIWVDSNGRKENVTKYLMSHNSNEGLKLENNKLDLTFKLVKDKKLDSGVSTHIFTDAHGHCKLKSDNSIYVYLKHYDGSDINTNSGLDLIKTYDVISWNINEPSNRITVSAVDKEYKILNRTISRVYGQRYAYDSGSISVTNNTVTVSGASFEVPEALKYKDGLKWLTLEVIDANGVQHTYLITNNTSNQITVHKDITQTPVSINIGHSSPSSFRDMIKTYVMPRDARGEANEIAVIKESVAINSSYREGIQFLRPDNTAFPIIDIGANFKPAYQFSQEIGATTACSTNYEINTFTSPIMRDMITSVTWSDEYKKDIINWFYPASPDVVEVMGTITAIDGNEIDYTGLGVVSSGAYNGFLIRIKMVRNGVVRYVTYNVMDTTSTKFTLSQNSESDGVAVGDTFALIGSVDFVWENSGDFKQIYQYTLGSSDDEKYNTVYFTSGINPVTQTEVLGFYFYEETTSDTVKDTYFPFTDIADMMMKAERDFQVVRLNADVWEGKDSTNNWTDNPNNWEFKTSWGVQINNRTEWVSAFREEARRRGKLRARKRAMAQKEETLNGNFTIRGSKFVTIGDSGSVFKFYHKGTRILFKKPDSGLANSEGNFYNLIVTKVTHEVDGSLWRTILDVEYDRFVIEEQIRSLI